MVKKGLDEKGRQLFPDVNVTSRGHRYLGSFIGSEEGKEAFVKEEMKK